MSLPKDTVPDPHADPLVASLLSAAAAAEAGACPETELLGLYADRDLDADATTRIEVHLHGCARCQAIVAACLRALPEEAGSGTISRVGEGFAAWFAGWRWLVPAASLTAVALVAVWIGRGPADEVAQAARTGVEQGRELEFASADAFVEGPQQDRLQPQGSGLEEAAAAPTATARRQAADRAITPPAKSAAGRSADAPSAPPASAPGVLGRAVEAPGGGARAKTEATAVSERVAGARPELSDLDADREARKDAAANTAKSAPERIEARTAPAQEAAAPSRAAAAAAPDAAFRGLAPQSWRVADGAVERTRDQGRSWQRVATPAGVRVVAVASPGGDVGWAIGNDVVLRTTDGTTWVQTARPASEPLAGVVATSATEASVFTASGARFVTTDGGRSWAPAP